MVFIFASNFEFSAAEHIDVPLPPVGRIFGYCGLVDRNWSFGYRGLVWGSRSFGRLRLAERVRRRSPVITSEKIAGSLCRPALLGRLRAYYPGRAKQNYQRCCSHFRPLEKIEPDPTVPRFKELVRHLGPKFGPKHPDTRRKPNVSDCVRDGSLALEKPT